MVDNLHSLNDDCPDDKGRSTEDITADAIKVLTRYVNGEVTIPDCPVKKARAQWKRIRILKAVARKLNPDDSGAMEIKVSVTS